MISNTVSVKSVTLQMGKSVTSASTLASGKFTLKIEKRTIDYVDFVEADYLLIASGSSQQVSLLRSFIYVSQYIKPN